jgi:outer membrane protein TolC
MKSIGTLIVVLLSAILPVASGAGEEALTWRKCVEIAAANNPDVRSSYEKIMQGRAGVGTARSVLLPRVEADASVSTGKTETSALRGQEGRTNSYSYGVTAKQLVFDGMKSVYDLKSAGKSLESAEYDYLVTSSNVRLDLRSAFVQLLRAQESIDLYAQILARRKQNLELVKMRYEAGREHRGSLLTAEASLARAQADSAQAARGLVLARHGLAKVLGLAVTGPLVVTGSLSAASAVSDQPDFEALVRDNPVLQKMMAQRELAALNVESAKAEYFPTVYGFLSADRSGTSRPTTATEWSAGVQMALPLFEGGATYHGVRGKEAALRQASEDARSTRGAVLFTMQEKWVSYRNALEDAGVQQKFLRAAEERAKIAESQYSIGLIQFDNWVIIEDNLVQLKKSYLDAGAQALSAEAEWVQSRGETLSYDE